MIYLWKVSLVMAVLSMLTGCIYTGDYDNYANTMSVHSTAEAERISSQSKAIMETVVNAKTSSPMESSLLAVIGMMQIERLHFTQLNIDAPTTGMDVLNTAVGFIPFATMGLTTYKIAERGFEAAGNVALNAENLTVSDAFNQSEVHATGEANSATLVADQPAEVDQPAKIDPVIIGDEQ